MPTRYKFTLFKRVVEKIPEYVASKLALEHKLDNQSRIVTGYHMPTGKKKRKNEMNNSAVIIAVVLPLYLYCKYKWNH